MVKFAISTATARHKARVCLADAEKLAAVFCFRHLDACATCNHCDLVCLLAFTMDVLDADVTGFGNDLTLKVTKVGEKGKEC